MKVTIVGAGAIGGLAGAYMARAGHDIVLVDSWIEHVDAINRNGMFIDGIRGEIRIPVRALTPDRLEPELEAVLIATKSQHTEAAARMVLPLLGPDGFIVSFQNGFNEPLIAGVMTELGKGGMERVVGGLPNYGGALVDPGHLEFVHEGSIELGEMSGPRSPRLRALAGMLESLVPVRLPDDIWSLIWSKEVYMGQVVFSALIDAPIQDTLAQERWARVAGAILREGVGIADANGVVLEDLDFFRPDLYRAETLEATREAIAMIRHAAWLLHKDQDPTRHVSRKRGGSGMWWDIVYRKRKSETEAQKGKLIEYGRSCGADTRLTERLRDMICEIEDGRRALGEHNLAELEAYVSATGKALP